MSIPRPEHPKPQFQRSTWRNLNGRWGFEIDNGRSGVERGLVREDAVLFQEITVPFCPESELSGLNHKDFMYGLWYQRKVTLTAGECAGRTLLHFGAVDYECDAYVNGIHAGYHKGGYISFHFDITDLVRDGENTITLYARDDTRNPMIPHGKQCKMYYSHGCSYTRTTGIWQTVWLEFMPMICLSRVKYDTNAEEGLVTITADTIGSGILETEITYEGRPMGQASSESSGGQLIQTVKLSEIHLWEPGAGRLYDVTFRYGQDEVRSYFGLRSLRLDDTHFFINGKSIFQRLILDQGFYPDGIYTAPTDADLERDIDLALTMGFNGARPHEKIFEERYLYYCDKKGYIIWGEYPNWGLDHSYAEAIYSILPEWLEELARDYNHPSIVCWCPFNETWDKNGRKQYDDLIRMIYRVTKSVDPYRPCIDTSGNFHVETDIFDLHDYEQDPEVFRANYDKLATENVLYNRFDDEGKHSSRYHRQDYIGGPVMMSEFGGIRWSAKERNNDDISWGYGKDVESLDDFKNRFQGLIDAMLDNRRFFGFCYTQLTDVEQEENGLHTDSRVAKFDPGWVRSVIGRKAAIEET